MRIEEDIKLDYADVLFRPKRSTLSSRKDVELKRTYKFKYSNHQWSGVPIMAANMDGVGEIEVAKNLAKFEIMTCLTKQHDLKTIKRNSSVKEIHKHLEEYCDELGFKMPSYRCLSWFSKFEKGNYAHIHHHGHHDISGVYYYKTNGEDGKIFFETPNPFLDTQLCYRSYGETWEHKPQEGKILLFPGWLRHGVQTNETDNTRISLSFNIYFNHSLI